MMVPKVVDHITEELEKQAKAREMHRLHQMKKQEEEDALEIEDHVAQLPQQNDAQNMINERLMKMNAKIESAQRKMTSKIGVLKRESKEFTEASDQKPVYEITGDSTGATKATAGRMSFGAVSDITP